MFRKTTIGMIATGLVCAFVSVLVAGCAGQVGKGEGEGCGADSDCNNQLFCQPVSGRGGPFCCPAPLVLPTGQFTSSNSNCQPK